MSPAMWAGLNTCQTPERALLTWLAMTPPSRMLVGYALGDRFAGTGTILADLIPADRVVNVQGEHDWTSWVLLWRLLLDKAPFG
jgi:hypothetical protein